MLNVAGAMKPDGLSRSRPACSSVLRRVLAAEGLAGTVRERTTEAPGAAADLGGRRCRCGCWDRRSTPSSGRARSCASSCRRPKGPRRGRLARQRAQPRRGGRLARRGPAARTRARGSSDGGVLTTSPSCRRACWAGRLGRGRCVAVRNFLAWGAVRARFAGERLPWLEAAAASRYPDDEPVTRTTRTTDEEARRACRGPEASEEPRPPCRWPSGPSGRPREAPRPRSQPPSCRATRELVVDPADPAAFAEIDAAVAAAEDGDRIVVRPGTYRMPVVVDRAVRIEGQGPGRGHRPRARRRRGAGHRRLGRARAGPDHPPGAGRQRRRGSTRRSPSTTSARPSRAASSPRTSAPRVWVGGSLLGCPAGRVHDHGRGPERRLGDPRRAGRRCTPVASPGTAGRSSSAAPTPRSSCATPRSSTTSTTASSARSAPRSSWRAAPSRATP